MPQYLSPAWIDAVRQAVVGCLADTGTSLRLTQVVRGGPEGDVTYHLAVQDGRAAFDAGPAKDEDVRLVQDWDTAVAVARGELHAQEAFLRGRIHLHGDAAALVAALPVFDALEDAVASVRAETTYP